MPTSPRLRQFKIPRNHVGPVLLLVILPILVNAPALSGIFKCDPELLFGNLGVGNGGGLYPGAVCFVDPTVAYISQPLGYLSAQDWLHGVIPWWNPYSGVGMPLAAEMQTQSFFLPFILLMHFHNGWLYLRILLQILTAGFTYAFLLELNVSRLAACLGGILFALNGAFFLTPHAPIGPIFALPMMLLGIEQMRNASDLGEPFGWAMFAAGLALSVYGGFPEVTYFDGLLVFGWAILRFFQSPARWRFGTKCFVAATVGLALTAPLTNAFIQYLQNSFVGGHGGAFSRDVQAANAAPLQMFPLIYGALAKAPPLGMSGNALWIKIGGWFGSIPVLLALYALGFKKRRAEAFFFLVWIIMFECRYFGVPGFTALFNHIPGVAATNILRFSPISVMFPLFALTALGVDYLHRGNTPPARWLGWILSAYAGLWLLSLAPMPAILAQWFSGYPMFRLPALGVFLMVIIANIFVIFCIASRRLANVVTLIMAGGAVALFLFSQAPAYLQGRLNLAGVDFLKSHADLSRIYTIGPFEPNFPARYGIAEVNYQELPAPALWNVYAQDHLYPGNGLVGVTDPAVDAANFLDHTANFLAVGVKYLIAPPGVSALEAGLAEENPKPTMIFHDDTMDIYKLPSPAPYASMDSSDCHLQIYSRQKFDSYCPHPATLIRREQYFPGWRATVNGVAVPVTIDETIFQKINVPAGQVKIRFIYMPPHTRLACLFMILAAAIWLAAVTAKFWHQAAA